MEGAITRATKTFRWSKPKVGKADLIEYSRHDLSYYVANIVGHRIYMFGSRIPVLFYLDIAEMKWCSTDIGAETFNENSSVLVDDRIMGIIGSAEPSKCLLVFDLSLGEWTYHSVDYPVTPLPYRSVAEYIDFARMMIVFGGYAGGLTEPTVNTLVRLNVDSFEAVCPQASGALPPPRHGAASCSLVRNREATIFIYGGGGGKPHNELYMLHFQHNCFRWSKGAVDSKALSVYSPTLNYVDGKLIIYGGFNRSFADTDDISIYELDTKKWHVVSQVPSLEKYNVYGMPEKCSTHRAFPCFNKLLVLGGFGQKFPWVSMLSGAG